MTSHTQRAPTIAPQLVTDRVYSYLESAILNGEIEGGSRLRVRQLADMVGTSVMPVREAISRLEDSGLAEREAHKGAVVKTFSVPELIDIYGVRLLLESEAARLGTLHVTDEDLDVMRMHLEGHLEALDDHRINEALWRDTEFLSTIYRRSGNDVLVNLIGSLWKQSHLYRFTVLDDDARDGRHRAYECNLGILEAVERRDAGSAERWVAKSVRKAIHTLMHLDRDEVPQA